MTTNDLFDTALALAQKIAAEHHSTASVTLMYGPYTGFWKARAEWRDGSEIVTQHKHPEGAIQALTQLLTQVAQAQEGLTYKGYRGIITDIDPTSGTHGRVCNMDDIVTFHSDDLNGAKDAFRDSIEDYLDYCNELKQPPAPPRDTP